MKINRYKKVTRHISFYANNFSFRQPYQLLIDGTFCLAALNAQVNIEDNIPKYLQGELKLLTTQCAIIETENLGYKLHGALKILKQYALHKCGHEGKPISGAKCFLSMVGKQNDKHYIIASQDRDLQNKLRLVPGVPLLYLHSKAPVLDPPSQVSVQFANKNLSKKYGIQSYEKGALEELKVEMVSEDKPKPKRKRAKGPNSLSCKKSKKSTAQQKTIQKSGDKVNKKSKKRIRISKHVKEELLKQTINA